MRLKYIFKLREGEAVSKWKALRSSKLTDRAKNRPSVELIINKKTRICKIRTSGALSSGKVRSNKQEVSKMDR